MALRVTAGCPEVLAEAEASVERAGDQGVELLEERRQLALRRGVGDGGVRVRDLERVGVESDTRGVELRGAERVEHGVAHLPGREQQRAATTDAAGHEVDVEGSQAAGSGHRRLRGKAHAYAGRAQAASTRSRCGRLPPGAEPLGQCVLTR